MTRTQTAAVQKAAIAHTAPADIVVTDNELTLLKSIAKTARNLHVDPVEMAVPFENPFETKHVGAGTMASCMRKGLVESQDYGTINHAVSLTVEGERLSHKRVATH